MLTNTNQHSCQRLFERRSVNVTEVVPTTDGVSKSAPSCLDDLHNDAEFVVHRVDFISDAFYCPHRRIEQGAE